MVGVTGRWGDESPRASPRDRCARALLLGALFSKLSACDRPAARKVRGWGTASASRSTAAAATRLAQLRVAWNHLTPFGTAKFSTLTWPTGAAPRRATRPATTWRGRPATSSKGARPPHRQCAGPPRAAPLELRGWIEQFRLEQLKTGACCAKRLYTVLYFL